MGAVPGFCGANRHSSMARKLFGQPPIELGTVPRLLQNCLNLVPFGLIPKRSSLNLGVLVANFGFIIFLAYLSASPLKKLHSCLLLTIENRNDYD